MAPLLRTSEVLERIRNAFGEQDGRAIVRRVLRVPPVWAGLKDPTILGEALERAPASIIPAAVLGPVAARQGAPADGLQRLIHAEELPESVSDLAALVIHFRQLVEEDPTGAVDLLEELGSAGHWTLACAWPDLTQPEALTTEIIGRGSRPLVRAALVALLANGEAEKGCVRLLEAGLSPIDLLTVLDPEQEPELSAFIAERALLDHVDSANTAPTPDSMFTRALADRLAGRTEEAQERLQSAWQLAVERAAGISDAVAELAEREGDDLVAVQARDRAFEALPTDDRRAALALATLRSGDLMDAQHTIRPPYTSAAERIAAAHVDAALGQVDSARETLEQVDSSRLSPHWAHELSAVWRQLDDTGSAIEALRAAVIGRPVAAGLRAELAALERTAGDAVSASDEAALAVLLDPEHIESHRILARSLDEAGPAEAALAAWLKVAEKDPGAKTAVVDSALAADEPGTALSFAQELVKEDPDAAASRVAMGKSLVAVGNPQAGREHLQRATDISPDDAEAWIALAQAEAQLQDEEAAGQTLGRAVQACPNDPRLQAAYADWLVGQEQLTEALAHAEKALDLNPGDPQGLIRCARLQSELGRNDEARALYREALTLRPSDHQVRAALADLYELAGQYEQALDALGQVPDNAPAASHALHGRLLLQITDDRTDEERGRQAKRALEAAQQAGYQEPTHAYWKGRAHDLLGEHETAMQAYQACLKHLPPDSTTIRVACICAQAEAAMAAGQLPAAISLLETAREDGLVGPQILAQLSHAYRVADLPEEALSAGLEAADLDPEDAGVREQLLQSAAAAQAWDLIIQRTDEWRDSSDRGSEFAFERALAFHYLGAPEKARQAIAGAVWADRRDVETLRAAARSLRDMQQPRSAQRLLLSAEPHASADPDLLRDLALTSAQAEDFETAHRVWERISKLEPQDAGALVGAAEALWNLDRRAASIGLLQRAVQRQPDDGGLHAKLARAQLENGEVPQALDHFRTSVQLEPEEPAVARQAARALLENGEAAGALEVLESQLSRDSQDRAAIAAAAEAYLEMGRPTEALATAGRLESDPPASVHAITALAQAQLGKTDDAEEALGKALEARTSAPHDLRWQVRAALSFGRWKAVHELIGRVGDDEGLLPIAVCARVRLANARWLIHDMAGAIAHGPPSESASEAVLEATLRALEQSGMEAGRRRDLARQLRLASGETDSSGRDRAEPAHSNDRWADALAFESRVVAFLRDGQDERALQALAQSAEVQSRYSDWTPLLAGLAYMASERYPIARKALGAVDKGSALHPIPAYLTAQTWTRESRIDEAINALNSAVLLWPDEPGWQHELATLYLDSGKSEAALPHLQEALEQRPREAGVRLSYARALKGAGQLEEAEGVYAEALAEQPDSAEVWKEAGEVALALANGDEAEARYSRALQIDPSDSEARIGAARAALRRGEVRNAKGHTNKVLKHPPDDAPALVQLAEILTEQDRDDEALSMYDRALRTAENSLSVHRSRSRLLLKMGRAQEAVQTLQRVVESNPSDDEGWYVLAQAYEQVRDADSAVDALRMALDLRPGSKTYRLDLARLHREAGHLDQALAELSKLEQEDPQDAQIAFEKGRVHQDRRQHQMALRAFERAIQLNPNSAAAHFHAGIALKVLKAYGRSAAMLRKAADLNPNDSDALHQLAAVQALELVHGGNDPQTSAVTP